MIGTTVLAILIYTVQVPNGVTTGQAHFATMKACEAAKAEIPKLAPGLSYHRAICVGTGA